ncbi:MAG TPA: hypothetical protein EYG65_02455 [Rhodospirillales bacterium]|nr:hypothetical protein [Rhodospirillales bacterium]
MLTYILNNQSGSKDAMGNTFDVTLTGKSTRTIVTAQITAARVRLQHAAKADATQEHLLMHSKALTSSGNTRFHHIVDGARKNTHIVATLRKKLSNNGLYDEFELANTHRLTLKHPLHTLDMYFTDNSGTRIPIGQGVDVTNTVWQRDALFTGTYKEELDLTYDLDGLAELVPDVVDYTWHGGNALSGTITGSMDSTWTRDGEVITVLWEDDPAFWYKMQVGANKAQLVAIEDYNNIHTPGTVLWEKDSGQFASAVSVVFTDNSDNTGSVDTGHTWAFSTVNGKFTFTDDITETETVASAYLGPNDKIRFKLVESNDPQYDSTAVDTVLYRENSTTITGYEPVSSAIITTPANGFYGEDLSLHVELNCLHRGN